MTGTPAYRLARRHSPAYSRVEELLAHQRCVILDGGISTELENIETNGYELRDDALWGTWALLNAPDAVTDVHRRYASVGCDVISTDTWGLQGAMNGDGLRAGMPQADWMQLARRAIRLARKAVDEAGRNGQAAVAFSLHGDVADDDGIERFELLARVFEDEPPDLVLLETMSLIQPSAFNAVQAIVDSGYPVWVSFRRCRHGLCGVFGEHWGGPEGDLFGRAARRFEEMGVTALLINCIPPDHVAGDPALAARLHRPAARRLPEPRLLQRVGLVVRRRDRRRRVRRARPELARRGGRHHRRLLRRPPAPRRGGQGGARGHAPRPRPQPRARRREPTRFPRASRPSAPRPRRGPTPAAAASTRCRCPS